MRKWIPSIIVMLLIAALSSIPGRTLNDAGLGSNALHISGHSVMFFILCFTYFKATKNIKYAIFLTILYGFVDEFHQKFTSLRASSMFDIYTDTVGSLLAGLILWKLQHILPKKLKNWLNK